MADARCSSATVSPRLYRAITEAANTKKPIPDRMIKLTYSGSTDYRAGSAFTNCLAFWPLIGPFSLSSQTIAPVGQR